LAPAGEASTTVRPDPLQLRPGGRSEAETQNLWTEVVELSTRRAEWLPIKIVARDNNLYEPLASVLLTGYKIVSLSHESRSNDGQRPPTPRRENMILSLENHHCRRWERLRIHR
jgi:hypothetical protein